MEKEQKLTTYRHTQEYEALVEECQAIITEGIWNYRVEKILAYGQLGERIFNDSIFKKYGKGNLAFLQAIAEDIGISYSDICRAIQFYEKFQIVSPEDAGWDSFREGKNISWSKIKRLYLPQEKRKECLHSNVKEIRRWQCTQCKKIFEYDPTKK